MRNPILSCFVHLIKTHMMASCHYIATRDMLVQVRDGKRVDNLHVYLMKSPYKKRTYKALNLADQ